MTLTWELVGSGLAALTFVVTGFMSFRQKYASASSRPAPAAATPQPQPHDVIAAAIRDIEASQRELRDIMQRNHAMTADDHRDILRTIDQLVNAVARIEASQRVTEIMAHVGKHGS
jgi:hypothetical protein